MESSSTDSTKQSSEELKALIEKRDAHVTRLFYIMLEFFFIFGVPAAAAFFAGQALDTQYETGKAWLISLLIIAFILSWVMVIMRTRKITKKLKKIEERIQELRKGHVS